MASRTRARKHSDRYKFYMQSSDWKKKRLQRLAIDNHECQHCHTKKNLHVHHLSYQRLGKEKLSDLITLCQKCHKAVHAGKIKPKDIVQAKRKMPEPHTQEQQPQQINVTTGYHPLRDWSGERQKVDRVTGHDFWLYVAMGITAFMLARSVALAIRFFNQPLWLVLFAACFSLVCVWLGTSMPNKIPKQLLIGTLTGAIGGIIGAIA